jgi:hypothetical protein
VGEEDPSEAQPNKKKVSLLRGGRLTSLDGEAEVQDDKDGDGRGGGGGESIEFFSDVL